MSVILNNNFSQDTHDIRAERLRKIQDNHDFIRDELHAPEEICIWAEDCYDIFMNKISSSAVDTAQWHSQTFSVQNMLRELTECYQIVRALGIPIYADDQKHLKDFDFGLRFPKSRLEMLSRAELIVEVHNRHVQEGLPKTIPQVMIDRLAAAIADTELAMEEQEQKKKRAMHSTAELKELMKADEWLLTLLKGWWRGVMGKDSVLIQKIGMVNLKRRGNPHRPEAPADFDYDAAQEVFSWPEVEGATSYEIVTRSAKKGKKWRKAWRGRDLSAMLPPPESPSEYAVRARNHNGYGLISAVVAVG